MAQPAPGWGTPQAQAAPPAGGGGGSRLNRRLVLIAAVVGVAVFAVSGVASFALSGGFGGRVGQSVSCSGVWCIPSLKGSEVVGALTAEGYECQPNSSGTHHSCQTQIGENLYEASVGTSLGDPEQISSVTGSVRYPEHSQPTSRTKGYLAWFASLPFSNDQQTVDEVTAWLNERVDGGQDEVVTIGGFEFSVEASSPGFVRLNLRGIPS